MNKKGFFAILYFDVRFWDTGLEIKDGVTESYRLVSVQYGMQDLTIAIHLCTHASS